MEQKYWDKFCATGDVYDYLGYKMEVYTHINGKERAQAETKTEADTKSKMQYESYTGGIEKE